MHDGYVTQSRCFQLLEPATARTLRNSQTYRINVNFVFLPFVVPHVNKPTFVDNHNNKQETGLIKPEREEESWRPDLQPANQALSLASPSDPHTHPGEGLLQIQAQERFSASNGNKIPDSQHASGSKHHLISPATSSLFFQILSRQAKGLTPTIPRHFFR